MYADLFGTNNFQKQLTCWSTILNVKLQANISTVHETVDFEACVSADNLSCDFTYDELHLLTDVLRHWCYVTCSGTSAVLRTLNSLADFNPFNTLAVNIGQNT